MDEKCKLTIKDFEVLKELGSGSFGKVKLVKKIENEVVYALKTVSMNRLNQK
jgi:serine/threonine protein kinase